MISHLSVPAQIIYSIQNQTQKALIAAVMGENRENIKFFKKIFKSLDTEPMILYNSKYVE